MVLSTDFFKIFQDFLDFFEASLGVSLKQGDLGNLGQSFFSGGFLFHTSNISEKIDLSIGFLARGQRIELCQMVLETFSPALEHCPASINLARFEKESS